MLISFLQNRIIGEDKTLSIKLGADAGNASTDDIIVIRGVSKDVDRAVKEIQKIVEDAKNDEIVSSSVRASEVISKHKQFLRSSESCSISLQVKFHCWAFTEYDFRLPKATLKLNTEH